MFTTLFITYTFIYRTISLFLSGDFQSRHLHICSIHTHFGGSAAHEIRNLLFLNTFCFIYKAAGCFVCLKMIKFILVLPCSFHSRLLHVFCMLENG